MAVERLEGGRIFRPSPTVLALRPRVDHPAYPPSCRLAQADGPQDCHIVLCGGERIEVGQSEGRGSLRRIKRLHAERDEVMSPVA